MFFNCYSLQKMPMFNTSLVTSMFNMIWRCYSLIEMPALSTVSITTTSGSDFGASFASECHSLAKCGLSFARTVNLQACQLSRTAIVEVFTNLADRTATTTATITITANFGIDTLTAADRLIATNKNWTIVG
jgi:hypothetical protein